MNGWMNGWMILNCEVDKTRVLVRISWHEKISLQTWMRNWNLVCWEFDCEGLKLYVGSLIVKDWKYKIASGILIIVEWIIINHHPNLSSYSLNLLVPPPSTTKLKRKKKEVHLISLLEKRVFIVSNFNCVCFICLNF
jgi:hypothetical protein